MNAADQSAIDAGCNCTRKIPYLDWSHAPTCPLYHAVPEPVLMDSEPTPDCCGGIGPCKYCTPDAAVPEPVGTDISGPKGSGGAAPMWCSRCRLVRHGVDIACQECGTLLVAAPIAPAAQELIEQLVRVLKMAKRLGHLGFQIGVDDAHGHSLSQWKEQEGAILADIDAALARAERKEGEAE